MLRTVLGCIAATLFASPVFAAAPALVASDGTVGNYLEAFTTIKLTEPAPPEGLSVTITSDDERRLVFSTAAGQRGSKTLNVQIPPRGSQTPDFYIQALSGHGAATYIVSAPGYSSVTGTITIVRSGVTIGGPSDSSFFRTTSEHPRKITARTAMFDDTGHMLGSLPVAGGMAVRVDISSSNPKTGVVSPSSLVFTGGSEKQTAMFMPVAPGDTLLSASVPEGFLTVVKSAAINVNVEVPGIGVLMDINIGKDLEVRGDVLLGQDAPANGLDVMLTSEDPARFVLSLHENEIGSKCITVHIPAGKGIAPYYLQALSDSGVVHYTASAPGYRTRVAAVTLSPSGMMVVFTPFGPPDEQEVLHPMPTPKDRPFFANLSDHKQLWLSVWSVYLDPATLRGADITAQRLRPGVSVQVALLNSDPAIATVAHSVTLSNNMMTAITPFQPIHQGQTIISVKTPAGFSTPSNATSVTAVVRP